MLDVSFYKVKGSQTDLNDFFDCFHPSYFSGIPPWRLTHFSSLLANILTLFFTRFPSLCQFLLLKIILMARISWSTLIKNQKQNFSYAISTCLNFVTVMDFIHSFIAKNLFDDPINSKVSLSTHFQIGTYVANIGDK